MSKLTAKKIKKCREIIRKYKKFKLWLEDLHGVEYTYSQISSMRHHFEYEMWLSGWGYK